MTVHHRNDYLAFDEVWYVHYPLQTVAIVTIIIGLICYNYARASYVTYPEVAHAIFWQILAGCVLLMDVRRFLPPGVKIMVITITLW